MNKQQDKNRVHDITIQLLNKEGYFISFDLDVVIDLQIEDNLNFLANRRRPQFFSKWKMISFF